MGKGIISLLGIYLLFSGSSVSAASLTSTPFTPNNTNVVESALNSAGHVTWSSWDGTDYEIYYWDGINTTQLTDNTENDLSPQINSLNHIVWSAFSGNESEINFWNGTNIIQLTNNSTNNKSPQINDKDHVVWSGWNGSNFEICYWNGATITQLTNNSGDNLSPSINNDDHVVWSGWNGISFEIYYWDGIATTQLSNNTSDNSSPQINDKDHVVWSGWDGNDFEIYYWNGATVTKLTDNSMDDQSPRINDKDHVVWSGWDGNDFEIYYWNGATTSQLTNNSTDDLSPQINNKEQISWSGIAGTNGDTVSEIVLANLAVPDKIGLFRTGGTWYLDLNSNGQWNPGIDGTSIFGTVPGDKPVVGDWTGDGYSKRGIYRGGTWYLDLNGNGVWDGSPTDRTFKFGQPTDIPVVGDWTGEGKKYVGLYRQGYWYLDINGNGTWDGEPIDRIIKFGQPNDIPVVGDWAGTGRDSVGVYRQGYWYLDVNNNGVWDGEPTDKMIKFGQPTDIPVVGDWTGKGGYSIGVYRQGYWYLDMNGNGIWDTNVDRQWKFGQPTDIPLVGNFYNPNDLITIDTVPRKGSFIISSVSGNTSESGTKATFTVRLGSQPTADVTIPVSSSDLTEGTVDKDSLTFTSSNWNQDQVITITGVYDNLADGPIVYSIVLGTTFSADSVYNGLKPADVSVTNTDVRSAGFDITPISGNTSESGAQATFQVRLASQPTADVSIPVSSSDLTEGTVDKSSLIFTNTNWNTYQTITVTGIRDTVADGPITYDIILGLTSSADSLYNGLDPDDVSVTNVDVPTVPGSFVVSSISGEIDESGASATFTVALGSQPTADVSISVSSSDLTEGTVDKSGLTFTTSNWATPQTVTVTGISDDIDDGNQTFAIVLGTATSDDLNYNGLKPNDVSVTNVDLVGIYAVKPAISAGDTHNLLLANDGSVWGWGACGSGQLDTGTTCNSSVLLPQRLNIDKSAAISAGYGYSAIVKRDGTVWTSGVNTYGQLGHASSSGLDRVENLTDVKQIAAGTYHVLSLKNDGTVWAWGKGEAGQLGNGLLVRSTTPVQATGDLTKKIIASIAGGQDHSLAMDNNGNVYSWGTDYVGQLGLGANDNSTPLPTVISSLSGVSSIGAGQLQSFAVGVVGGATNTFGWGSDGDYSLGMTMPPSPFDIEIPTGVSPVNIPPNNTLLPSRIDGGVLHTVALGKDGNIYTWGDNEHTMDGSDGDNWDNRGALGIGSLSDKTAPTLAFTAGNPGQALDVNAGSNYTLVLFTDGRLQTSGLNTAGQLGSNEIATSGLSPFAQTPVFVEDPSDLGAGSITPFYAYRPILAGYPATSTDKTTATISVCPNTLVAPANCGLIQYYKYSTDSGSTWSPTAIPIATPINLHDLPAGTVNLWVKGMINTTTEIQTDNSAVKVAWTVKQSALPQ